MFFNTDVPCRLPRRSLAMFLSSVVMLGWYSASRAQSPESTGQLLVDPSQKTRANIAIRDDDMKGFQECINDGNAFSAEGPYLNCLHEVLKNHYPSSEFGEGIGFALTKNNSLPDDWLVQTPGIKYWGKPSADVPFGAGDYVADMIQDMVSKAQHAVDIMTLAPFPNYKFMEAIRKGLSDVIASDNNVTVRILAGRPPIPRWGPKPNQSQFLKSLITPLTITPLSGIAVGPGGMPWGIVSDSQSIVRRTGNTIPGISWERVPSPAMVPGPPAPGFELDFVPVTDIDVGPNGTGWAVAGGKVYYRPNGTDWVQLHDPKDTRLSRIAVGTTGMPWGILDDNLTVVRRTGLRGSPGTGWKVENVGRPGNEIAVDIGVGANGEVWMLHGPGGEAYYWSSPRKSWLPAPGNSEEFSSITVGPDGMPWATLRGGSGIVRRIGGTFPGTGWEMFSVTATDIDIGPKGEVWAVSGEGTSFLKNLNQGFATLPTPPKVKVIVGVQRTTIPSWNHAKIVAVDGKTLLVGGENLWADKYLERGPVFDLNMKINGPAVFYAHRFADKIWESVCGYRKFDSMSPVDWDSGSSVDGIWQSFSTPGCVKKISVPQAQGQGSLKILGAARFGTLSGTKLTAINETNPADVAMTYALNSAENTLRISQQSLLYGPFAWEPLLTAIAKLIVKGGQVYIVVSNGHVGSAAYAGSAAATLVRIRLAVIKSLVNKFGISPSKASDMLCKSLNFTELRFGPDDRWPYTGPSGDQFANHAKFFMVDDNVFYVGSDNLYSADLIEYGVFVSDPTAISQMRSQYWDKLWGNSKRVAIMGPEAATCQN